MSEIEKRIATAWAGHPTTADVEATRDADLRAVLEVTNALAARVSALETASAKCPSAPMTHEPNHDDMHCVGCGKAWIDVSCCCDTLVVGVNRHENGWCASCCSCKKRRPAPSPAASLVERMAEALALHCGNVPGVVPDPFRLMARAALRVAAEGLLGHHTLAEHDVIFGRALNTKADTLRAFNDMNKARLAAALEACR